MPATPMQVASPLLGATISGNTITIDSYVNPPTIIPEVIRSLVASNAGYFAEKIFATPGFTVQGGAIIYTESFPFDLFLDPDQSLAPRAPGAESPIIGATRRAPVIARPESIAGKIEVYDETRLRNNVFAVRAIFQKTANTFADRLQTRALQVLTTALSGWGRDVASVSWGAAAAAAGGAINVARNTQPGITFAQVNQQFMNDKTGIRPDTVIVNPADGVNLRMIYDDRLEAVLRSWGITDFIETPLQTAGQALFLKAGQVGVIAFEKPLSQEYARGPVGTFKDVYALEMAPIFVASGPDSIVRATGIA